METGLLPGKETGQLWSGPGTHFNKAGRLRQEAWPLTGWATGGGLRSAYHRVPSRRSLNTSLAVGGHPRAQKSAPAQQLPTPSPLMLFPVFLLSSLTFRLLCNSLCYTCFAAGVT